VSVGSALVVSAAVRLEGGTEMMEMREREQAAASSDAHRHSEGKVALAIEQQTARLPSDLFLWAAFASIGGSLILQMSGKKDESLFVGQWAPTFLALGLYNKLVKVAGSDRTDQQGI
jgi:hypothetical protein